MPDHLIARTRSRLASLLVVLIAVALEPAAADRLELRNGDVITGTIQLMDAEHVVIRTEYGVLDVQRSSVLRGEFGVDEREVVDSLVFRFSLDGNLNDSGGSHLLANNGMRFVADGHGSAASAMRSDGSGTYLSIAPTAEINSLDQLTLAFRVHLEDLSTTQYLLSKWNRAQGGTADGKFTVQTVGGNLTAYFVDPAGKYDWVTATGVLRPLVWHAIAVTFSGGKATLYVDGESVATDRFDFTSLYRDASPILVMTAQSQTADPYKYYNAVGAVDDLRLYSRALSPDEVRLLANGISTP